MRASECGDRVLLFRPVKVTEGIYQLPAIAARVTVLTSAQGAVLVDTGLKGSAGLIARGLKSIGVRPERLTAIAITHHHPDHIGGIAGLQAESLAFVVAHLNDAPFVNGERPPPNPYQHPLAALVARPALAAFRPTSATVDVTVDDGDRLPSMDGVTVIHTPGHTPGSICLHDRDKGVVIVGDALEYRRGTLSPPAAMFTKDMDQAMRSLRRLLDLDFETICFSHFPPLRRNAKAALRGVLEGAGS